MKSLGTILLLLAFVPLRANPIAMPSFVMTGENVIVGVSKDIITVMGTYRFHVVPDRAPDNDPKWFPIHCWIRLPIPVPKHEKIGPGLLLECNPELVFHGVTFKPSDTYAKFSSLPLVEGLQFMSVEFHLGSISEPEFEVTIRYTQPIIHRDGKMWAYYMPLIENFEVYKKSLKLSPSSYAVSFEAYQGTTIGLKSKWAKILQQSPRLISVEARNREVLEVEIVTNE